MTTAFSSSSRLANFRQKKNSLNQDAPNIEKESKLTLPAQTEEKTVYQPSSTTISTRTSTRLFKGRIQRNQSNDKQADLRSTQTALDSQNKITLPEDKSEGLKLVINDSPQIVEKKAIVQPPPKAPQKRILIKKTQVVQQQKKQEAPPVQQKVEQKKIETRESEKVIPPRQEYINPHDQKPIIKQEDVQESKEQPQNQNDLVICPQGCGRKFNRRALEKHAKACKIVFMSKRKQFNSEAKRITSKEQAIIAKQNKQKQKAQLGKTKSKGFEKTGDNWKAASEDFRQAIKAVKKQEGESDGENENNGEDQNLKLEECQFCAKKFAHVLIEKHLENCVKKKEKDRKKTTKKK